MKYLNSLDNLLSKLENKYFPSLNKLHKHIKPGIISGIVYSLAFILPAILPVVGGVIVAFYVIKLELLRKTYENLKHYSETKEFKNETENGIMLFLKIIILLFVSILVQPLSFLLIFYFVFRYTTLRMGYKELYEKVYKNN